MLDGFFNSFCHLYILRNCQNPQSKFICIFPLATNTYTKIGCLAHQPLFNTLVITPYELEISFHFKSISLASMAFFSLSFGHPHKTGLKNWTQNVYVPSGSQRTTKYHKLAPEPQLKTFDTSLYECSLKTHLNTPNVSHPSPGFTHPWTARHAYNKIAPSDVCSLSSVNTYMINTFLLSTAQTPSIDFKMRLQLPNGFSLFCQHSYNQHISTKKAIVTSHVSSSLQASLKKLPKSPNVDFKMHIQPSHVCPISSVDTYISTTHIFKPKRRSRQAMPLLLPGRVSNTDIKTSKYQLQKAA
jgi:hypothetical protein